MQPPNDCDRSDPPRPRRRRFSRGEQPRPVRAGPWSSTSIAVRFLALCARNRREEVRLGAASRVAQPNLVAVVRGAKSNERVADEGRWRTSLQAEFVGSVERGFDRGTRPGHRSLREFGDETREARIGAALSQTALGRVVRMSAPKISRLERAQLSGSRSWMPRASPAFWVSTWLCVFTLAVRHSAMRPTRSASAVSCLTFAYR
jgi:hypothetical protein